MMVQSKRLFFLFLFHWQVAFSQHCEKGQCNDGESVKLKTCKYFDFAEFNNDSPSIMYGKYVF